MTKITYKWLIIISFSLIIFFIIYNKYFKKVKIDEINNAQIEEEKFTNSNQIKDIKYSSKDLKGNEYIILAKEGEIDLNNSDIIFLKDVTAYIKLKKIAKQLQSNLILVNIILLILIQFFPKM